MMLAAAIGFVGIAVYLASNQAFSMLSLSNQYAAAITPVYINYVVTESE
jgi:hypothetical protein